ncbi:protein FRA10AC1 homolog [Parasteatoda tepidariorum]|uniref:protein FRA10AC1 homolog n=1 Tax=Parasteatoda tepidariorum TaxID=114398 RepID=UPI001C71AFB7|nr:protein FRA10AC1 homolog [Parasteatoda tepidariorum]
MSEACGSREQFIDEDYESEFEFDTQPGNKRKSIDDEVTFKTPAKRISKPNRQTFHDQCALEQGRSQQQAYQALDAYTRHKKLINDYVLCYSGTTQKLRRDTSNYKTDHDIIRENHKFLWEEDDDAATWGEKLAKKYYDRLFKEYCLCDLSRYKDKKVGMRWRTEKELIIGKGQFFCGNIRCDQKDELNSWEVLFSYVEKGEKKSALVKLRLCERCSDKLHYGYKGKAALKKKKEKSDYNSKNNLVDTVSVPNNTADEAHTQKIPEETNIWKQKIKEEVEQSKEDAFEEFLEELLL